MAKKKATEEESSKLELNAQINSELGKVIDDLILFDDDLMSKVFDGNIEATQLLLKIVLQREDISVISVKGQVDMKSPYVKGRDITLDIHVIDGEGTEFDDGSHIIFVNGVYKGDDDFGKLAHDFNCKKADDIYYKPLADGVRHFKETKEGRDAMCESFSKLADKVADERADLREEQTKVNAVRLIMKNLKCSLEDALNTLEISGKERAIIAKQLQK